MCTMIEDRCEGRKLKWEEILLEERSGRAIQVEVGCFPEAVIADLNEELMKTRMTSGK